MAVTIPIKMQSIRVDCLQTLPIALTPLVTVWLMFKQSTGKKQCWGKAYEGPRQKYCAAK